MCMNDAVMNTAILDSERDGKFQVLWLPIHCTFSKGEHFDEGRDPFWLDPIKISDPGEKSEVTM